MMNLWFGETGTKWDVVPLREYAAIGTGHTPSRNNEEYWENCNIPWLTVEDIRKNGINSLRAITDTCQKISELGLKNSAAVLHPKGTVMLSRTASIGFSCVIDSEMATTQAFVTWAPDKEKLNSNYLNAALMAMRDHYFALAYGATHLTIYFPDIKTLKIPLPSLEDQEKIANFLDHETAKIETLIEKQQLLIKLLNEKRQSLVSHAVATQAGDGKVKISYLIEFLSGYAFPSSGFKEQSSENIKLLRGANVGVGNLKWEDVVCWPKKDLFSLEEFVLRKSDIVFGMDRPWISTGARVAEVKESDLPCLLVQRVARIRARPNAYQPYIKLCFQSEEFQSFVESDLTGVSVPHISPDQIKSFSIRDISYAEQKNIYDEVRVKLDKINETKIQAESFIELLSERRTALISAAVTGKIDVRNWQTPQQKNNKEAAA